MFRFVAMTWQSGDGESEERCNHLHRQLSKQSPEWSVSFEAEGLRVLHAGARKGSNSPIRLAMNCGVALGTLFSRNATISTIHAITAFTAAESAEILSSHGRHLVEQFWGRYVAFITDGARNEVWVLRDPVGAIPCYIATWGRVRIFFSFADDIVRLGVIAAPINWEFVAAHVFRPRFLRCAETGLVSVKELLAGECWHLERNGQMSSTEYWSPADIVRAGSIRSPQALIQQLRDTTELCVTAWASCYPRIAHLLSGGLDSSIVLHCIHAYQPNAQVTALTFYNSFSRASDERRFAALMAEATQCELVEIEEDPAKADLEVLLSAWASVKPWEVQYYQTHATYEREVTNRFRADAVFSGSGGDHLLFQGPITLAATDYLHDRGLDAYLLRLCFDIALAEGLSFWAVLSGCLRDGWGLRRWTPERHIRRTCLATPEVAEVARRSGLLEPSWLRNIAGLPYGKLEHIRMCSVPHDFYNPFGPVDGPERVSPLISQPLIELCLQTPLYSLAAGSQDRAAARAAFANALPPEITARRTKGTADAYVQRLLARNRRFARELLVDGMLVSRGYLDREKLERVLSAAEGPLRDEAAEVIIFHLNTEAWLRRICQI